MSVEADYIICQIDHADGTLYYGNRDIHMDDENFYAGRLSLGDLRQALPGLLSMSAAPFASIALTLALANRTQRDIALNALLIPGATGWANAAVRLYTARTSAPRVFANYTCRFEGKIRFPKGFTRTEKQAIFMVDDLKTRDRTKIPKTFVTSGDPIPIIYGAFEEPYRIGMKDQEETPYKLATHPLYAFDGLFYKGETDCIDVEIQRGSLDIASSPSTVEIPQDWHGFYNLTLDLAAGYDITHISESIQHKWLILCCEDTLGGGDSKVLHYDGRTWTEDYADAAVKVTWESDGRNIPWGVIRLFRFTDDGKVYVADEDGVFGAADYDFSPQYGVHAVLYSGASWVILDNGDVYRCYGPADWRKHHTGTGTGLKLATGESRYGYWTSFIYALETLKVYEGTTAPEGEVPWVEIAAMGVGNYTDAAVRGRSELCVTYEPAVADLVVSLFVFDFDSRTWKTKKITWWSNALQEQPPTWGYRCHWFGDDNTVKIITSTHDGYCAILSWDGSSLKSEREDIAGVLGQIVSYRRNDADYALYSWAQTILGTAEVLYCDSQEYAWTDMTFLCQGKMVIGGSDLLNHPPEIIDDILRDLCGVTTGEIDAASWAATLDVIKPGSSTYRIHGVIDSVVDSHDQIQEICRECGLICGVKLPSIGATTSKYFLDHWKRSVSADASHIDVRISDPVESEDCDLYFNRMVGSHKLIPWSGNFTEVLEIENASAISQDGVERSYELASKWRFDGSNDHIPFSVYINNLLSTFSKHIQMQTCGIGGGFWYELAQKLHLTWDYLATETPMRILDRTLSFLRNHATYKGWNQRTMWDHPDMFWGTQNGEVFRPDSYPAMEQIAPGIPVPLHGRRMRWHYKTIRTNAMFKIVGSFAGSPIESDNFYCPSNSGTTYDVMLEADISGVADDTYAIVELWAAKIDNSRKIWDVVLDMVD